MGFAYQNAFYFLGVSLAFIVSFLLIRSTAEHKVANRLLGVAFFSMAWYNMAYLLALTGAYAHVYWLAGWGPSISFLIWPCAYLYVRLMLLKQDRLVKKDWWHFIPFFVFFLDLLPFNLGLTHVSKSEYVGRAMENFNQFYLQRISLIPLRTHFALRPIQAVFYLFFQWRILIRHQAATRRIHRWLLTLTVMQTVFYVVLALMTTKGLSTGEGIYVTQDYRPVVYALVISFFAASLILLSVPDALYGLRGREPLGPLPDRDRSKPESIPEPQASLLAVVSAPAAMAPAIVVPAIVAQPFSEPAQEVRPVNARLIAQYVPVIETYLTGEQPYLQPKLSIQDMAVATRIPLHQLSYIINQHYGIRYTDLVNQYRVVHAKHLFAQGVWRELSMEGLGRKCGFSNRTNFFLVFKKFTGLSPSEYLNTIKFGDNG